MHDGRRGLSLQRNHREKEGVEKFLTVNRVNADRKGVLLKICACTDIICKQMI